MFNLRPSRDQRIWMMLSSHQMELHRNSAGIQTNYAGNGGLFNVIHQNVLWGNSLYQQQGDLRHCSVMINCEWNRQMDSTEHDNPGGLWAKTAEKYLWSLKNAKITFLCILSLFSLNIVYYHDPYTQCWLCLIIANMIYLFHAKLFNVWAFHSMF